jgi:hypothetical protein
MIYHAGDRREEGDETDEHHSSGHLPRAAPVPLIKSFAGAFIVRVREMVRRARLPSGSRR